MKHELKRITRILIMAEIILKDESYLIIGICMEVHRELGMGFKEVLYKDAIEVELREKKIPNKREKNLRSHIKALFCLINFMQIL